MKKNYYISQSIYRWNPYIFEAALFSLLIILAVFPDVIFNDASLRITDQIMGHEVRSLFSVPHTTGWWGGYNDNGGASFQAEPMMEFMRDCFDTKQSPYWNPYSAAGSLGPESLVDQKFSFFTVIYALLGGGSKVYNILLLSIYYFSLFFLYRTAREVIKLSVIPCVAVLLFFLLNGFSVANTGSNILQCYFYVPFCLYASLLFISKASTLRAVSVVFSFAMLLSCTFMPTTITSLIGIYSVIIGFIFVKLDNNTNLFKKISFMLISHGLLVLLSVCLLAIIYFPIFENLGSVDTLGDYAKRIYFPIYFPQAIASLFSPSHFYESYNAMEPKALYWVGSRSFPGNTVYHMGVTAIVLAGCALFSKKAPYNKLAVVCALSILLIFGRLFDVMGWSSLISSLPILGKLGAHYWWPSIMIPMTVLVGLGTQNLINKNIKLFAPVLFILLCCASLYYINITFGLQAPNLQFKVFSLRMLCFLLFSVSTLIFILYYKSCLKFSALIPGILVATLFVELVFAGKMMRLEQNDFFSLPSGEIEFLKSHAGLYRTMNIGQTGLRPELGSAFQIQEITSMNQGIPPAFLDYYYSAVDLDIPQRFGYHTEMMPRGAFPTTLLVKDVPDSNKLNWSLISLLGVKYITVPAHYKSYIKEFELLGMKKVFDSPSSYIFENINVFPRAFSVDYEGEKVLNNITFPAISTNSIGLSDITKYKNTNIEIKGQLNKQSIVVLTDNFHSNWKATLNGNSVPIVKVNKTFRGIIVPKGQYVINMTYQPKSFTLAVFISFSVFLVLILASCGRRLIDRKFFS